MARNGCQVSGLTLYIGPMPGKGVLWCVGFYECLSEMIWAVVCQTSAGCMILKIRGYNH